jgi:hypothetical protein
MDNPHATLTAIDYEAMYDFFVAAPKVVPHECGHAMGYILLGGKIEYVSTDREWLLSQGHAHITGMVRGHIDRKIDPLEDESPSLMRRRRTYLEKEIMVTMAGRIGVQLAPLTSYPGSTRDSLPYLRGDRAQYVRDAQQLASIQLFDEARKRYKRTKRYEGLYKESHEDRDRLVPAILLRLYRKIKALLKEPKNLHSLRYLVDVVDMDTDEFIPGEDIHAIVRSARREYNLEAKMGIAPQWRHDPRTGVSDF